MAKPRTDLDVLKSITRQIDSLTPEQMARVLAYLRARYFQMPEAQGK
jgi:hypothetical protein